MRYYKLIILVLTILVISSAMNAWAAASIPLMIPYSGTIAVDGAPFNGDGQFKFAIVNQGCEDADDATPCTAFWSNDGSKTDGSEPTNSASIPVSNGNFAVKLGDTSLTNMLSLPEGLFDSPTTYLRIWFNDGVNNFQLLSPDRQLVSVPYAFRADVADKYTGTIGSSQITAGAVGSTQINKAQVQSRVSQTCSPGLSIREIKEDGTVTCENDDTGSTYTAGTGISISGNAISINNTQAQSRVSGTCAAGSSIRTVNADGTVVCETDDVGATAYIAGTGIDSTALSTGTIKIADGGVGSTQIDNTQVQSRITGTCAAGSSISTINADGTVTCEPDDVTSTSSTQAVQTTQIAVAASNTEIIGVDFTCPENGFVIAQGYITADINHTTGTTDNMYIKISNSIETNCCEAGWTQIVLQSALPTASANRSPAYATRRFSCTAGIPVRYRINANMIQGWDASDKAGWGTIVVQYVPN